jgi:ADP-heptose:LPS heptosyltransferase
VLTSTAATPIAALMDEVDEVITFDFPWVKNGTLVADKCFTNLTDRLREKNFDAAVVFTVYSQNPLPAVMLAYLADIPQRLAYCRENPYQLLTRWIPDEEPYSLIKHQVRRDLDLVANIGAFIKDESLKLTIKPDSWHTAAKKLAGLGVDVDKPWLIIHAGVSEVKRAFPLARWVETGSLLALNDGYQIILTGSKGEKELTDTLAQQIGHRAFSTGGLFNIAELVALIAHSLVMLTVNTGTVHIAAATNTPVVVLYALTNPQHTPWMVPNIVLPYQVDRGLHSKNEIIKYVNQYYYRDKIELPKAKDIVNAVEKLLANRDAYKHQELKLINWTTESSRQLVG